MRIFPRFRYVISLLLLCMALALTAQAASLNDGTVSTIVGVNAGLCLGVKNSNNEYGATLQSQTCNGSNYQQWKMNKDSANSFVPIASDSMGTPLYAPLDSTISSTSSTCQSLLGRDCEASYDTNAPNNFVINSSAMSAIKKNGSWLNAVKSATPKSYSVVKSQSFGPQAEITY
jgi:hypothetical protein